MKGTINDACTPNRVAARDQTVNRQIEVVREHFAGAVTAHRVLTRAVQLGLEVLAAEPTKLTTTKEARS